MKFNGEIMHFHPSRPDRLLGFSRSGELWAVVGNIEFSNTRPIGGWVRLYGDNPATITDVGGITFMYNPDDNRTVSYITRIE